MSIITSAIEILNEKQIKYCIFKEFDLIEKAFEGEEDIDLLICKSDYKRAKKALEKVGYKQCLWPKPLGGIYFYIGYNKENNCRSLLHIHTELRIGTKQAKEFQWKDLENKILNDFDDNNRFKAHVIKPEDEICLLFIRMTLRKRPNEDDYSRLEELSINYNINEVPLSHITKEIVGIEGIIDLSIYQFENDFGTDEQRYSIRKYLWKHSPAKLIVIFRLLWAKIHRFIRGIRRVFNCPTKPTRHIGKMYAILGVDGSGKSTAINSIINNSFMQSIGVKRIYCGNNEYWIPGLNKASEEKHGALVNVLCNIDKRLRIIYAAVILLTGRNVLFDRYFYDDYVAYIKAKKEKRLDGIKLFIKKIYNGWIGIKPYKTFYLKIDPEEAYKRKPDGPLDVRRSNILYYDEVVKNRKEITVIDASHNAEEIVKTIIEIIAFDTDCEE